MKAAFVINARDKQKFVYQAAASALSQTYPCDILLSDQFSKDETYSEMERAVHNAPRGHEKHEVRLLRCPIEGPYSMRTNNKHFDWLWRQTDADWIFQCSADDYSLPGRVEACMKAVEENDCAVVACHVQFEEPGKGIVGKTGWPTENSYVNAGEGMTRLAYGSTIQGFSRKFLEKVGSSLDHTMDVYYGFLGALDLGFYCVSEVHHVHVMHSSLDNMGFQGKMRAAPEGSEEHARLAELNRFQLLDLYYGIAVKAEEQYKMMHESDRNSLLNMILAQTAGWLQERKNLHEKGITPGVL